MLITPKEKVLMQASLQHTPSSNQRMAELAEIVKCIKGILAIS